MLYALLIFLVAGLLAWRIGFYRVPTAQPDFEALGGRDVLAVFFIYLAINLIVFPLGALVVLSLLRVGVTPQVEGWAQVLLISVVGGAVGFYCLRLKPQKRWEILREHGRDPARFGFDASLGAATWLLGYPAVLLIGQALSQLTTRLFDNEMVDQVAVQHLKETFSHPTLFLATAFVIVFVVPVVEELLFRGFLQSWLRRYFSWIYAIVISSLVFSLFHFSLQQGIANIELLSCLFVFSLFLGYVYERQQSLVASIALHTVFNGISVLMILAGY